jgi:hypothetical protein
MSKLGRWNKTTVAGKGSALCAQDSVAPLARFARLETHGRSTISTSSPERLMTMRRSLSGESEKAFTVMVI